MTAQNARPLRHNTRGPRSAPKLPPMNQTAQLIYLAALPYDPSAALIRTHFDTDQPTALAILARLQAAERAKPLPTPFAKFPRRRSARLDAALIAFARGEAMTLPQIIQTFAVHPDSARHWNNARTQAQALAF